MTRRLINEKHRVDPANKATVLDQWMTPPCAVEALIGLEREHLPRIILEPCCGDGTGFVEPLRKAGYEVVARDIDPDFGFSVADFLNDRLPEGWPFDGAVGIVSNPPFTLAEQFVRKAIAAAPYSAWLLRLNWLEGCARKRLFDEFPPARIRVSSRRLPFHRLGYTGPKAASNVAHAFFIWDRAATNSLPEVSWFDFREMLAEPADARRAA
jgi:hypothetical protein